MNDLSLELFSGNLLSMMRGAMMMMFVVMLIGLHPRRNENSILGFLFRLLVVMSALLLVTLSYVVEDIRAHKPFYNFMMMLDLSLIPLIGSYLMKIVIPDWVNWRRAMLLISPTILLAVTYAIKPYDALLTASFIYTAVVAALVFLFVVVLSIRYDKYLKDNYSNIDNRTVGWVRRVIYAFAGWYIIWGVVIKVDSRLIDSAYYLFLIVLWAIIYRYSLRHVKSFSTQELFDSRQDEEPKLQENRQEVSALTSKLESFMKEQQLWQNPALTLQELAEALGTNRSYLSVYLNKNLDTTFYDYLNKFRIEYACGLLLSNRELSTLQVSERSGFNSISTFRRAFERQMDCTPAEYRKRNTR